MVKNEMVKRELSGQMVVKQEPESLDSPDLSIVHVKIKKKVSDKRRGQLREAEANRKNKVRSRRAGAQIQELQEQNAELREAVEHLEGLKLQPVSNERSSDFGLGSLDYVFHCVAWAQAKPGRKGQVPQRVFVQAGVAWLVSLNLNP